MIVWEYICDGNNNIITIQQWNQEEKPEFENNPEPSEEMKQSNLIDEWGNYLYKLEGGIIIENEIELDDKQKKIKKLSKNGILDMIRILIKGIDDPNDSEFLNLKSEIEE